MLVFNTFNYHFILRHSNHSTTEPQSYPLSRLLVLTEEHFPFLSVLTADHTVTLHQPFNPRTVPVKASYSTARLSKSQFPASDTVSWQTIPERLSHQSECELEQEKLTVFLCRLCPNHRRRRKYNFPLKQMKRAIGKASGN